VLDELRVDVDGVDLAAGADRPGEELHVDPGARADVGDGRARLDTARRGDLRAALVDLAPLALVVVGPVLHGPIAVRVVRPAHVAVLEEALLGASPAAGDEEEEEDRRDTSCGHDGRGLAGRY
jgi:hypothetical protein